MKRRILVIDDDEDILFILNIILKDAGYEVILCKTGKTAVQIKLYGADLIILDIRINGYGRTGAQICAELKADLELRVPVLLVSAEVNVDELARESNADGYVKKPFDIDSLLLKVKEFIS